MAKVCHTSEKHSRGQRSLPPLQFHTPLPYGAILHKTESNQGEGVQFVVFSRNATGMRVLLYDQSHDRDPTEVISFEPKHDRFGDVWSIFVPGLKHGQLYHFQADGLFDTSLGQSFDPTARLIDPYSKALAGHFLQHRDGIVRPPKSVVVDDTFDWRGDQHLRHGLADTVIYEMHVKGFTADVSSGVTHPGTYLGVIEKIPYLKSLGITAVELMPVHEFPLESFTGKHRKHENYWGYDPLAFFAPHQGYAASKLPAAQVSEFKEMVRALHAAGIEVILDVVFNHTAEGNAEGPTLSMKGLENSVYYMLDNDSRAYQNYTGCGNTINANHPVVRELIILCLRHWVHTYHVDGFRFDLASILSRDPNGKLVENSPVIEAITEDPMLADTKIIAEAWDAAGAYQVGTFATLRWAEWNGRYRDDVRRYWRGDANQTGNLATRLAGSSDLYAGEQRQPYHSINFITSHDGFTLNDLVCYEHKHNEANGENNNDGDNNNFSSNYGVEGPTVNETIESLRSKQIHNMLSTLFLSQGVPMLLAGDECRRTQKGNNNAYCQDNEISWFDWQLTVDNADLVQFTTSLIHKRLNNPTLRRRTFLEGGGSSLGTLPDVEWFSPDGSHVDWFAGDKSLVCFFGAPTPERLIDEHDPNAGGLNGTPQHVLIFCNASTESRTFHFPSSPVLRAMPWEVCIDTGRQHMIRATDQPHAIDPLQPVILAERSLLCLLASGTRHPTKRLDS